MVHGIMWENLHINLCTNSKYIKSKSNGIRALDTRTAPNTPSLVLVEQAGDFHPRPSPFVRLHLSCFPRNYKNRFSGVEASARIPRPSKRILQLHHTRKRCFFLFCISDDRHFINYSMMAYPKSCKIIQTESCDKHLRHSIIDQRGP